ncbi:MAG: 30S ribosomal protein S6 [Candidatus Taylorbacteria bacterium RIFCSPHIGHO2_01_FULL_46_22b]|uniref:Small ribosomal subunit protein bS6 n=1 Tax=Candidatus Taylorbacteria bacterium RIFCSPHIGHO2_01_FULL_46_22b TaxID=1802301 RepID=A0A1G2M4G2_9BACT|nr:MAG: 30S ribosomal protein S6 [Candidatus Taylorbacteria bacterium RIFCSPHIGHO2_01_FULL_46_22b]
MVSEQNTEEKGQTRVYEVAYLVSPHVAEDKIAEVVSHIKQALEQRGAFVISDEYPKFRPLAYTVVRQHEGKNEKYQTAYFGWVKFELGASTLADLKKTLEQENRLIRFLIVKVDRETKLSVRPQFWRKETVHKETPKPDAPKMTEAEIDKTIEELVVE